MTDFNEFAMENVSPQQIRNRMTVERWGAQVCNRQVVNRTVRTVVFYRHL